jgi:hypothetical protein
MTIGFDSSSGTTRLGTANPTTWSHTPVGTPKGVVVAINQMPFSTDWVSGVSYGGVDLSRVVRATDVASTKGAADLWFRGSGLPAGAQTFSVSFTSATTTKMHIVGMTLTAAGDTEVLDFDSINGNIADPSVTLQYSTRTCLALAAHYGGATDPASFAPNSNCTFVANSTFGNAFASSNVIRQTTAASADFAIGGTSAVDDNAYAAVAIGEIATASSTGTVVHVESSAFTVATADTGGLISIPVTTESGDDLYCFITSRDHTNGLAYPTCTDNESGGNVFEVVSATGNRRGTIYWKKATGVTAGKTITVAGAVGACAAGVSVYRNALPTGNPISNVNFSSVNTTNPVVPGFTPDVQNSMIGIAVFNYEDDVAISAISCLPPLGSLTSRFQMLSTGTKSCAVIHASSLQTTGLSGTGDFTWVQAGNHKNIAAVFAIRSSATTVASSTSTQNSGTTQSPVHTYASAGTYVVSLIVTDNDGNASSATTQSVHVA